MKIRVNPCNLWQTKQLQSNKIIMSKKNLNVGLIGYGLSGRFLIAPFLTVHPNFRLATIVQRHEPTALETYPSVKIAKSLDELLADATIDLVVVSSPNETHYDYTRRSLEAGKHVLVEKPMAATADEAEILIALAKKQGKILSVYQNRRFDGDFRTVRQVIESGLLGDILTYEAHFDRWQPNLNPKKWKEIASPMTGVLYDLGAHLIDQAVVLFGKPSHFDGKTMTQRANSDIDDAFDLRLDYGKTQVTLKASLLAREPTPRYIVHGSRGSFVKYGIDPQEDQLKSGLLPTAAGFGADNAALFGTLNTDIGGLHFQGKIETLLGNYGLLFENLYAAIADGAELLVKPEQVLEQILIMERVKELKIKN